MNTSKLLHVVIYSGGMDSFTLLHGTLARAEHDRKMSGRENKVLALSFQYGQRHSRELDRAKHVTAALGIEHVVRHMTLHAGQSSLMGAQPIPEGHYEAESMRSTVVPGRNLIFLAFAASLAESRIGPDDQAIVCYGAHAGDHHIYPDCRPEFAAAASSVMAHSTDGRVVLVAPFLHMDKARILLAGADMGLSAQSYFDTWTCYQGDEMPCGKCGACQERAEAFAKVGWIDPTYGRPWPY